METNQNLVRMQMIKRLMVTAAVICLFFGIKTNAFAATPTLKIEGTAVNIGGAATGNGSGGGSWSYTPASGSSVAKLTLTNYRGGGIDYQAAPASLTIVLVGSNSITTVEKYVNGITYYTDSNHVLTIEGAGSLSINSGYFGIQYADDVGPPYSDGTLVINANLSMASEVSCINSPGSLIVEGGSIKTYCEGLPSMLVNRLTINGGNITAYSRTSDGIRLMNSDPKFEINGGTVVASGGSAGINGGYGHLYFNDGSQVTATSTSRSGMTGIFTRSGQIHFNGGEVLAQNTCIDLSSRKALCAAPDATGQPFIFGDSQYTRAMIYYEGSDINHLKRVSNVGIEPKYRKKSTQAAVHIFPKLKASVKSNQKNATIKLTNKTPTYGSGPAKSVTGIRGETISLSVSCPKDKKIGSLYYYQATSPSKKIKIDTNTKTFAMPGGDVVVGATIIDKVKVKKITLNKKTLTLPKGKTARLSAKIKPSTADDKGLTWKSSNKKIATVSQNGVIKGKKYGTVTITVTAKDGSKKKASCKVSVGYKITYKLYGGKNKKSNPSSYYNQKVNLKHPVKAGYAFKGWYTNKRMTKKITTIAQGKAKNYTLYAKWKKVKAPSTTKLTKVKNTTGRKIELTIRSVKNADGYQITYGTNASMTEKAKTVSTTKTKKVLKNLTKGKTYYVKVRAYQLDSAKKKIYGNFSQVKKVAVKK